MRAATVLNLIVSGLLLWTPPTWAVSKVGGGTLSNEDVGFYCSIPLGYQTFYVAPDQDVKMDAPHGGRGSFVIPRFLVAHMLENEQPEWVGKTDASEFANHFAAAGWTRVPHVEPCVEQWEKPGTGALTRVLSWGDGRGVIFVGPSQYNDVRQIADSLRLVPGACSWK